jgi:hypothetical protein
MDCDIEKEVVALLSAHARSFLISTSMQEEPFIIVPDNDEYSFSLMNEINDTVDDLGYPPLIVQVPTTLH